MYKRNTSWELVLHKNYKECIREISPGNQYFIKTRFPGDIYLIHSFIVFMKYWFPGDIYLIHSFIVFMKYWFPGDISLIHSFIVFMKYWFPGDISLIHSKNYKGMFKINISWEPVLHKNYKECITEISPGNQYFIKTIKECIR
jgi:hypothetical protein